MSDEEEDGVSVDVEVGEKGSLHVDITLPHMPGPNANGDDFSSAYEQLNETFKAKMLGKHLTKDVMDQAAEMGAQFIREKMQQQSFMQHVMPMKPVHAFFMKELVREILFTLEEPEPPAKSWLLVVRPPGQLHQEWYLNSRTEALDCLAELMAKAHMKQPLDLDDP